MEPFQLFLLLLAGTFDDFAKIILPYAVILTNKTLPRQAKLEKALKSIFPRKKSAREARSREIIAVCSRTQSHYPKRMRMKFFFLPPTPHRLALLPSRGVGVGKSLFWQQQRRFFQKTASSAEQKFICMSR
jgi:hypothetical protein